MIEALDCHVLTSDVLSMVACLVAEGIQGRLEARVAWLLRLEWLRTIHKPAIAAAWLHLLALHKQFVTVDS